MSGVAAARSRRAKSAAATAAAAAVACALAAVPSKAGAQTAALLPVVSEDAGLARSVEDAIREALLASGYLLLSGEPVTVALEQSGLTAIASIEEGQRVGRILGADVLISTGVRPTWISVTVMHLPSGSIETREGELPSERVDLPGTVVANLADAVSVMIGAGVQMPAVSGPAVEPPPVEPPPVEPPPVEPPPVEPPAVEPPPVEPPPEEPPAFYAEGPFHVRVDPGLTVLLNPPEERSGGSRVGGRVGLGFAYAVIPELDLGLEFDILFGQGTALDLGVAATYRFPLIRSIDLDLAPHLTLGYFQLLTGTEMAAFFARASADVIWSITKGYAIYLAPVCFSIVAGGDGAAALYEAAVGFLGSF